MKVTNPELDSFGEFLGYQRGCRGLADTLDLLLRRAAVPAEGPPAHHRCTLGDPTLGHSGAFAFASSLQTAR